MFLNQPPRLILKHSLVLLVLVVIGVGTLMGTTATPVL